MKKIRLYSFFIALVAATTGAYAQWDGRHFIEGSFTAPKDLLPIGQKISPLKNVYYVRRGGFGSEYLTPDQSRIKVPENFTGTVFVNYESRLLTESIKAALTARGIRLVDSHKDASIAITGDGYYLVTLPPHLMRRLPLNKTFDEQNGKGVSIVDAESHKTSRGEAALSLSTSAVGATLNPAEFIGRLVTATMDLSGATSRMEKAFGWNERQRKEQSFTFGDCYDNDTRLGSCEPGQKRNMTYTHRARFQVVDLRTFVTISGEQQKTFNIIARIIDDRTETKDDLPELLTSVVAELLAGFPSAPPVVAPAETAKAQPVALEQAKQQDDSAKTN